MLQDILAEAESKIGSASNLQELQQIRIEFLGKQSRISQEMQKLGKLAEDERKKFGQEINVVKERISSMLSTKGHELEDLELALSFEAQRLDLTAPARSYRQGSIHPITQALEEMVQVFSKFGFVSETGPNIENEWYNFTALNMAENHPARQMHDTFYLKSEKHDTVLRTHTSTVQIRAMESKKPPFRFIAPGRTYRSDYDMTHTPMFHQIEGLVVDRGIHMGHLKYVIIETIHNFFGTAKIDVRFRPSFFPFTEPSAEVDIKMHNSDKWLEVMGCGMVHPNVLKNVNIEPEEYTGFAFGFGLERFAMLKYGIQDLRQFFDGDLRFLKHYNFKSFDIPNLAMGLSQ